MNKAKGKRQEEFRNLATALNDLIKNKPMHIVDRIVGPGNEVEYKVSPLLNNEVVTVGRYLNQDGKICDMGIFVGSMDECKEAISILRSQFYVIDLEDDARACHYGTLEDCEAFRHRHQVCGPIVNAKAYKNRFQRKHNG